QISLNLKEKLNIKEMQIEGSEMFGHKVINLIPIYEGKKLEGKKQPASKKILEELQKELEIKIEPKKQEENLEIEKKPEIISEKNTWLPKRLP
ncbi:MAG: hypothetical protein AABX80_00455, partial [Nanoarchaeota archaeon]